MPTVEERVTRLEKRMDEQERFRAAQDEDQSDLGLKLAAQDKMLKAVAKTQSEHTALLHRHTAMHKEHAEALAAHTIDLHLLKDGVERIIGMLDTLITRENDR
ncbi:hypothetical protein [Actinoplanes awajinensis]|uniref:Uncharacterized protein n=1 Tax=Actinoplanes awajinensis subsp. mycoplanecinus TaxID=135947 RepID=A0A0X3VCA5_9ACTN|nr:hypothetical protein [Actinoplanes awajinensis]KUL42443.1 hypothetical protein ADL15_00780 [Actinoplanes awajinensis subsp. mycoplanecinus]